MHSLQAQSDLHSGVNCVGFFSVWFSEQFSYFDQSDQ